MTPPLITPTLMCQEPSRSVAIGKPVDTVLLAMVEQPQTCRARVSTPGSRHTWLTPKSTHFPLS